MDRFPITRDGLESLKIELKHLKSVERPSIIQAISEARELGDLSENAEYHAARERQSFVEGRIIELEDKIARADVIDISKLNGSKVTFGATVTLIDDDTEETTTYQIVGESEANLEKKKISYTSPIAKAVIGKEQGDIVDVITPSGKKVYEILSVEFV
jgi:transcription elongation factor GreA